MSDDIPRRLGEILEGTVGRTDPNNRQPPDAEPLVDSTDYDAEYDDAARDLGGGGPGRGHADDEGDAERESAGDPGDGVGHLAGTGEWWDGIVPDDIVDRGTIEDALRSSGLRLTGGGGSAGGDPGGVREGGGRDDHHKAIADGARRLGAAVGHGTDDAGGPSRSRFRELLIDGLNRDPVVVLDGHTEIRGRVFKVTSLANGEVSMVFHVDAEYADSALRVSHLRNKTVDLSITEL